MISKFKSNRMVMFLSAMMLSLCMFFGSFNVASAEYQTGEGPLETLEYTIMTGTYTYITNSKPIDYSANRYKKQEGGYIYWYQLFAQTGSESGDYFDETNLGLLSNGAKQEFLEDVFRLANYIADDSAKGYNTGDNAPTDDTVTDLYEVAEKESGMAGTLLASIMSNTKPDYSTANRIYQPFSGVVGTILGVVSVLIMAFLGVTMALDLAYITIPAFQMAMGGTEENGNGTKGKGIGGLISQEAKKAVQAAEGGAGGQAGDGSYKAAVGVYFKYRWKGLVLLVICLLYLVQGQIYSFVGWFIDLFSGFLGF